MLKRVETTLIIVTMLTIILGALPTGVAADMRGFIGDYEITCPDEIVEIIVMFATPPAVSLWRKAQEGQPPRRWDDSTDFLFREQSLEAHARFQEQLGQILGKGDYEIFSETHYAFNGVHMRVRSDIVESIAELPEVAIVEPHVIPQLPNFDPAPLDFLKNSNGRIRAGVTITELITELLDESVGYNIEVIDIMGNTITDLSLRLGTGMEVVLFGKDQSELDRVTVIVPGDVNGDGQIDIFDVMALLNNIFDITPLSGANLKAADVGDRGQVDIFDVLAVLNHVSGVRSLL